MTSSNSAAGSHSFDVVDSETLVEAPIIALRRDRVRMPGGRIAAREIVEHFGAVAVVMVSGLPSTSRSLLNTFTVTGVSSLVLAVSFVRVGASLTAAIVTVTVAVGVPPWPSLTV